MAQIKSMAPGDEMKSLKTGGSPVKPKRRLGKVIFILLFIAALVGFGWSSYNYYLIKKEVKNLIDGGNSDLAKQELTALTNKVGKLIVLPQGEDPVIATVKDAQALAKDSEFYKDAQNGDKLFIYQKARKAIIYRESQNILVNVGPIFFNNETNTNQPAASTPPVNTPPADTNTNTPPANTNQ
jgi:hypothetical protein